VEVSERKQGKREVGRVLYDDLDLDMDIREDEFVERIWKVWSKMERERGCAQVLIIYKRRTGR
jgi:hypothetical protein